jgi:glycosyltransferase involved in cell wall biosynthesis
VRPLSLDGKTLVSLGRPKMMADYLLALAGRNEHPRFFPLLHDMIPLHEAVQRKGSRFSSKFADDNHLVIRHSAGLLANSAFTKSEIESFSAQGFLPALPPVTAVPLAHELRPTDETVAVHPPEEPFLVCVGGQTGRKNLECIVSAMMLLSEKGLEVPMLVLAGARRKRTEQYLNRPEFAPIRDRIQILINPNQAELRALYEKALALVIPSRMEGWGLPLGEALWVGTPGLAASVPALQEVGGDLVRYFDPDAPAELAEQIDRLQSDPEDTQALRDRIAAARDELRSWKDVAQDILRAVQARLAAGTPD